MFFGRKEELSALADLWGKNCASLAVCSGRRRVGKSTLVEEFARRSGCRFIEIVGLSPDEGVDNRAQLRNFCERLSVQTGVDEEYANGWAKAFDALYAAVNGKRGKTIVFLDEISWMGAFDKTFPALLKTAWDTQFSKREKLIFVVCGSVSTWINKNILRSKAFVGRISCSLKLEEMPLSDCREFWGSAKDRRSVHEMLDLLCVTGGIPKYLTEMRPSLSADENIRKMCFTKEGYLYRDFDAIFTDVFAKTVSDKAKILACVAEEPQSVKTLAAALGCVSNGHLSDSLGELVEAGFLSVDEGLNPSSAKEAREVRYRICDNYVRFYLKFILPRKRAIERGAYKFVSMDRVPGWDSMMGLQFETLVRNNLSALLPLVGMGNTVLTSAAPYVRRGKRKGEGVQIDLLLQTRKSVCIVEIKRRKLIPASVQDDVRDKIRRLKLPRDISVRAALVYDGELAPEIEEDNYFDFLVPAERLFE